MGASCEELMLLLLHEESRTSTNEEFDKIVSLLREGSFKEIFEHDWFKVFKYLSWEKFRSDLDHLKDASYDTEEIYHLKLLTVAVVFLSFFIQRNFVGPLDEESPFAKAFNFCNDRSELLNLNGEIVCHLVKDPGALLIAKEIFLGKADELKCFETLSIWQYRYASTHQQFINERVQYLQDIVDISNPAHCLFAGIPELWCQIRLESALINLEFYNHHQALSQLQEVAENIGFSFALIGALGARTRFQKTSLPQLSLSVERSKANVVPHMNPDDLSSLPKNATLQDDTVLDRIKFEEEQESSRLNFIEQNIILVTSVVRSSMNAAEELLEEQVMTYYSRILDDPQLWTIQFSTLHHRSLIEAHRSRKVERALSQLQILLDCIRERKATFAQRFRMFFAARISPIWKLERDLANTYISLGLTKSALDIFLRLEMWEEVVNCYLAMQRNDRAEALVRRLLEAEDTPLLHCLLGEITGEPDHYNVAWSLSGEQFARAKRCLAVYHFKRQEYAEAIVHFREALELNRLHGMCWKMLAFCLMKTERFADCVYAYKQTVNLNPDNFEAWNNMARAFISLGEKEKAWRVLQEAIKCNYEDWRIWENYILVSMDVGAFNEVVKCWNRLIDLKRPFVDEKVAKTLVKAVAENLQDLEGNFAAPYLREKLFTLFGRVTANVTASPGLWEAYATLYEISEPEGENGWLEQIQKCVQCYQKAIRSVMQNKSWEKETKRAEDVLGLITKVWSALNNYTEKISAEETQRVAVSLAMTTKNATTMISRSADCHPESLMLLLAKCEQEAKLRTAQSCC